MNNSSLASKIAALALCGAMAVTMVPAAAFAQGAESDSAQLMQLEAATSGKCSDDLTWSFNASTGELSFFGTGDLPLYYFDSDTDSFETPWESYRSSIKKLVISEGITSWGIKACVHNTPSLASISVAKGNGSLSSPDGRCLVEYGRNLIGYANASGPSYVIPAGVSNVGYRAFSNASLLESLVIPENVTNVDGSSFENCTSLKSVKFPSSLETIQGFEGCTALESVYIPEGVLAIGNVAFKNCASLVALSIPASVKNVSYDALIGCKALKSFSVAEGNEFISSPDGRYLISGDWLVGYANASGSSFAIPETVRYIDGPVFEQCTSLTSVTIPKSMSRISDGAFAGCTSLASIAVADDNPWFRSPDGRSLVTNDSLIIYANASGPS